MNAVRHKDSGKAEWGERDVVPLSPAVRKANRLHEFINLIAISMYWRLPLGRELKAERLRYAPPAVRRAGRTALVLFFHLSMFS